MDLNSLNSNQTCQCSSSGSTASVTSSSSRSSNGIPEKQGLRTIHLRRELGIYLEGNGKTGNKLVPNVKPNSFGFSFRGGREFGTGFFVSAVEKDSEAQYKGLKVGDQIIRINGLSVDDATHREVLQLAQSRQQLTLTVKSVGIIPVKDKSDDPVTWKLVDSGTETRHIPTFGCDVERILIEIPENTQLGCGICKGPDWRPGIFIQYTKPNSLARRCGLQPGDQILQCNRISFLQIDFSYAVSVLKNSRTLDLVLKKGSGIDLFPGESSGYSSSSSVADEAVGQSPPKSKRLSMVAEEGDDRGQRKSCHCKSLRNKLKSSGSIDSIFDNISNEGSTYREKSKSIEILTTDLNDRKTLTYRNGDHISRTLLNFKSGPETGRPAGGGDGGGCVGVTSGGRQTVIKINGKELGVPGKCPTMPPEKKLTEGLVSVEVHRSNNEDDGSNGSPGQKCSSSSSSLSSAISQEIQKRNERRLKGITNMTPIPDKNNNNSSSTNNGGGSDKQPKGELMKPGNRQQRHQHDLLIAELKKKQGWEEKPSMQIQESRPQQINGTRQKVPDPETDSIENGLKQTLNNKVSPPEDDPPHCPTPDYFSDTSLTDQSIEASHIVKSSILKFEEKHKRPHPSTGVHKTVTFGQNSTKEITPLKNSYRVSSLRPCNNNNNNSSNHHQNNNNNMGDKKGQDRVEIQSIDSLDMIEPKKVAPKPPPVYFQPPVRNNFGDNKANTETKKRTTIIKITEYPTDKRREPGKFDFLNRKPETNGFDSELASTLLRSNLKNKTDAFANYSNGGTVIKIGNDRTGNGVGTGKYNGFHPMPPVIPTGITESQISSAKKSLKTFEKNTSNTVVLKIPKIN